MSIVKKDASSVVKLIRSDPTYQRLRESFETVPIYRLPTDELQKEIETLHKLREVRRLNPLDPRFIDAIVKANTTDQTTRSRLTEISLNCFKAISTLEAAMDSMRKYLIVKYTHELRQYRTKDERLMIINIALKTFLKYIDAVRVVHESASMVVSDIDKAAWSLKLSLMAVQTHSERERTL